jgi:hypothetical protein
MAAVKIALDRHPDGETDDSVLHAYAVPPRLQEGDALESAVSGIGRKSSDSLRERQ